MKWLKERDDLIAQTKAFVQSVTGRRPEPVAAPVSVRPAPIDNPFSYAVTHPILSNPAPKLPEDFVSSQLVERTEQAGALAQTQLPQIKALDQSDVRQEIQNRIAAFQAHQHRFEREREAYFKSVLTRVRSEIKDGRGDSRS